MADILLSYERTDRQRVAPIVALLESCGWSVCWEPHDDGEGRAEHELAAARCVVVAWSLDSVDSAAVRADASRGLARGILIAASIDFSRPPPELEQAPTLAFAGWSGDVSSPRAQELLSAVGELLGRTTPAGEGPAVAEADALGRATDAAHAATAGPPAQPAAAEPAIRLAAAELQAERPQAQLDAPADSEGEAEAERVAPRIDFQRLEADLGFKEEEAANPGWAPPDTDLEAEEQARIALPPVLLREARQHPEAPEEPVSPRSGRRLLAAAGLLASLAGVAAAAFVLTEWAGQPDHGAEVPTVEAAPEPRPRLVAAPTPAVLPKPPEAKPPEVKPPEAKLAPPVPPGAPAVKSPIAKPAEAKPPAANPAGAKLAPTVLPKPPEAKPAVVAPTPTALPEGLDVEDLLAQVTPRVEELLAGARQRIRNGDIRGARTMLQAPETAHSGLLTFLLAETYDPNVLPTRLKGSLADPEQAKALYRKARELGDARAQGRLDALRS